MESFKLLLFVHHRLDFLCNDLLNCLQKVVDGLAYHYTPTLQRAVVN